MSIGRQSVWGIAIKATSILVGFVVVALLARILSPALYGTYSVALAAVTVLAIPAAMGLPRYVVRETAAALGSGSGHGSGDGALVRRIVVAAVGLVLAVALVVVALALGWSLLWGASEGGARAVFWIGLGLVPGMALTQVMGAALMGIGQSRPGLLVGQVLRHLLFLLGLLLWITIIGGPDAFVAMGLHVVASFLTLAVGVSFWFRRRPAMVPVPGADAGSLNWRAMLASTGVMGIIAGAQTLNANLDIIMVGALKGAAAAGIYKLASTAALLTVAGLQAINMVMMPHFARIHREANRAAMQRLATQSVRLILLTALPCSAVLVLFGRPLLGFAFGAEYLDSYLPMVILVVGQLVSALFGSVMTILNMTGHEVDTMKGVLLGTGVNVVLNAILIPIYGATGAAIATAATLVAWNIYLHRIVRRRLGINSTLFPFLNVTG